LLRKFLTVVTLRTRFRPGPKILNVHFTSIAAKLKILRLG
jgi:hypothetical protein